MKDNYVIYNLPYKKDEEIKMADWVIVVDDDTSNLKMAGHILSRANMRVTALKSGQALLNYVKENGYPDLVLLDINMPEMDGFETLTKFRENADPDNETPVIFLTADENEESETKGLSLGAVDFIKKPFVPEVLTIRVRHIIDLNHLQKNLAKEVKKKTEENEKQFTRFVQSLANAIDAKDRYTSGHSQRVANYAVMIAERMGKDDDYLQVIYYAGLLHDVGKIRIPEGVINKPGKLTDDEFDSIRIHSVSGFHILRDIHNDERIAYGAKYHHERYDGTGYPNGLEGDNIPEIARIIAVADAYDAMASERSYRKVLPQAVIREEISNGKGSQFDPAIADIMLQIIDEDPSYEHRQQEAKTHSVLVVDDDKIVLRDVKRVLKDFEGLNVFDAVNTQEALNILSTESVDLILLDLIMPEKDGFEFFGDIRKEYDMPVILMTGDRSIETIEKINELHIDDYLTKPLNEAITCETVHGILHRKDSGV